MSYQTDGVTFRPAHLAKQSRPSKHMVDFFFPLFKEDTTICPVVTLRAYEDRTKEFRDPQSPNPKTKLFLSWIGQHNPVTSSTIARWLKLIMCEAGIDISIFKSHSIRGATCSKKKVSQPSKYWKQQIGLRAPSSNFTTGNWMRMTKLVWYHSFVIPRCFKPYMLI